jgi:hypothetical protein
MAKKFSFTKETATCKIKSIPNFVKLMNIQIETGLKAMPAKKRCRRFLDMSYCIYKGNILEAASFFAAVVVTPLS